VRGIGLRALTASIVNVTVGAGIFVLPGMVGARLGAAAPLAYVLCALTMGLIVASLALAGRRVTVTGGPYAYVEAAFGPHVAFVGGVLLWSSCVLAAGSVGAALATTVGLLLPPLAAGAGRLALLALLFTCLAVVNVRGVRQGAGIVQLLTVAKLLPLFVFVAVGALFVDPGALAWSDAPAGSALGETVLLLVFAFVGVELALVPSGEVREPARTVPRAVFLALGFTTLLYLAIQLVAQGILGPDLARSADAPLAEASARFLGRGGRALVLAGTAVSMLGYLSGDMLGSPRLLFAFGRDGVLPAVFASVHPAFRSPHVAIVVHALLAFGLALVGSFGKLVLLSNVAVLLLYLLCSAGAFELTRRDPGSLGRVARLGSRVVPLLACGAVLWILSSATFEELAITAGVAALASVLYLLRVLRWEPESRRSSRPSR
jgi:APA family basic amino acid/polyamine antiporter